MILRMNRSMMKIPVLISLCVLQNCSSLTKSEARNGLRGLGNGSEKENEYGGLHATPNKIMFMEQSFRVLNGTSDKVHDENDSIGSNFTSPPSMSIEPTLASTSSTSPSMQPQAQPQSTPSLLPSDIPSSLPTTQSPTDWPTSSPSQSPTTRSPTDWPSSMPIITNEPSSFPSVYPTEINSSHPSTVASLSPSTSVSPTLGPTPECHDLASYQSPLYELPCTSFIYADCRDWINMGFNEEQVLTLLQSCPESCNVSCGYLATPSTSPSAERISIIAPTVPWDSIMVDVDFYINDATETLNDTDKAIFERISLRYLSTIIDEQKNTNLISFIITEQEILNYRLRYRRSLRTQRSLNRSRNLNEDESASTTLHIKASISALTSGEEPISSDALINELMQGIENEEYGKALATELPYNSLMITSISDMPSKGEKDETGGVNQPMEEPTKRKSGSKAFMISTTVVLVSMAAVGIGFLYRRRAGLKRFMNLSPQHRRRDEMSDGSHDPDSYGDGASYDDGMNTVDHSFLSRVLSRSNSPLGLSPRTSEVDEVEMGLQKDQMIVSHHVDQLYSNQNIQQETSDVAAKKILFPNAPVEEQMNHSHIPPMIVIDNIDDEAAPPQTSKSAQSVEEIEVVHPHTANESHHHVEYEDEGNQNGMVVRRIEATSDLVAAFSAKKAAKPLQAYSIWHPFMEDQSDGTHTEECLSPQTHLSSRLSLGAGSSISTPNTAKVEDEEAPHTKKKITSIFNFDPENEMEDEDDFAIQFEKKMKEGDKEKIIGITNIGSIGKGTLKPFRSLFKKKKKQFDDQYRSSSSLASHYESDAGLSEGSSVLRERDRIFDQSNQDMSPQHQTHMNITSDNEDPKMPPDDSCSESSEDEILPIERHGDLARENNHNHNHNHHRRISSSGSIFTHTHRRTASESSFTSGFIYSFLAPCSGKLGIIIQSKPSSAPTIFQVKDYSPLLGQVQRGDKIVAVDGDDTSSMTTAEITTLLAMKRSAKNDKTQRIKVTIMSKYKKEGIKPDREGSCTLAEHFTYEMRDGDEEDAFSPQNQVKINVKQQEEASQVKYDYSSGDDQSCHLIGTVNTEDENDDIEEDDDFHMMGSGADQFL